MSVRRVLITPPVTEPLSLGDVKTHLRVDADDMSQDVVLQAYIGAARELVETRTGRALWQQTWDVYWDGWPSDSVLRLPCPPLQSVTSLKYVDGSGVTQTIDPSLYVVRTDRLCAEVYPAYNVIWPTTRTQQQAIVARIVCGYSPQNRVPSALIAAMLLLVGDLYEHREARLDAATQENPALEALLAPYKVTRGFAEPMSIVTRTGPYLPGPAISTY